MAGISLILQNNPNVTQINCGTSSPRLGGTVDISAFPNLSGFTCDSNDITAINGYAQNSNLIAIRFIDNKVTGVIPPLSGLTKLQRFDCSTNQLTGPIPSLSGLTNLREFRCFTNQLTGPIPSLSGLTNLTNFRCDANQLTGPIPSLSGLTNLQEFRCYTNQLTGFDGGSVSNTLGHFQAQTNQLTQSSVNALLSAFVAAGRTTGTPVVNGTCILNLGGTGNYRPTGQGVTDVTTLRGRGWTVTTGTRQ